MRLVNCWFCSSTIYPGHGIQFVRNDAKIFRFCRSKCHKNFKMKRNPRKVKWTKAFRAVHGKDMTKDKTFEFEKKRNRPERYDRNLTADTLVAIKKIVDIRHKRQAKHIQDRLKPNKKNQRQNMLDEIDNNISLIRAPGHHDNEKIKVEVSKSKSALNEAMEE